jgi:hypothetical protein
MSRSAVILLPHRVFATFPFVLTLEGQYIVKNMVLIAAALVIGATVRGGRLVIEGPVQRTSELDANVIAERE